MKSPPSRRQFLHGVGGVTLALPLLPSLLAKTARAADAAAQSLTNKRFITITSSHGWRPAFWWRYAPSDVQDPQDQIVLPAMKRLGPDICELNLSDIGDISPIIGPDWNRHKSDMLIIKGLYGIERTNGHNCMAILGGWLQDHSYGLDGPHTSEKDPKDWKPLPIPCESINSIIARKIYGEEPAFRTLDLYSGNGGMTCVKTASGFARKNGYLDPVSAFNVLFGSRGPKPAAGVDRQAELQTLVDLVCDDLKEKKGLAQISGADKLMLESFADFMHEHQKRIIALEKVAASCTAPGLPAEGYGVILPDESGAQDALQKARYDNALAAIMCGLTNVVQMFSNVTEQSTYLTKIPGDLHSAFHNNGYYQRGDAPDLAGLVRAQTYQMSMNARFIDALKQVENPATGARYLDSSLVYIANEVCSEHGRHDLDAILVGSCGGAVDGGRALDFRMYGEGSVQSNVWLGVPYTRLLYTIMKAFGLTAKDWEGLANFEYSLDSLGQFTKGAAPKSMGTWMDPLPFIKKAA